MNAAGRERELSDAELRAKFEEWAAQDACPYEDMRRFGFGEYSSPATLNAWIGWRAAWQAARAPSAPGPEVAPVAWMHDQPGRVDVIHKSVKELWLKVGQTQSTQFMRELVPCKVEHYTIPLYAAPNLAAATEAAGQSKPTAVDVEVAAAIELTDTQIKKITDQLYMVWIDEFAVPVEILHARIFRAGAAASRAPASVPMEPMTEAERLAMRVAGARALGEGSAARWASIPHVEQDAFMSGWICHRSYDAAPTPIREGGGHE